MLGEAGVNIGTFHLGRRATGGEAVLLWTVCRLPGVKTVKALTF